VLPSGDWAWGLKWTAPPLTNSSQVRGTATALAEAKQKVAAFEAELAQQEHGAQLVNSVLLKPVKPTPKRVSSGWLAAG
jgi:hypothetical protein